MVMTVENACVLLQTVKINQKEYQLPLKIVSYEVLEQSSDRGN